MISFSPDSTPVISPKSRPRIIFKLISQLFSYLVGAWCKLKKSMHLWKSLCILKISGNYIIANR